MVWKQIEATPSHLTYLLLSSFLIFYALFSTFIRNRLHLSEPPLATLFGIVVGPKCAGILDPTAWGFGDNIVQEFTRFILGVQVFTTGVELPKGFFRKTWWSLAMLLGPVMAAGWLICALFIHLLFHCGWPTSLVIAACLTPTDPVLAASVLSNSQFSSRVPTRIRDLLSAESGCNDGVSFPFLYIGLCVLTRATVGASMKKWFLITILWQCCFGTLLGAIIGDVANRTLKWCSKKQTVGRTSYLVFYLLLAVFCNGVGSTLGSDDFLLAFTAGAVFARDGWFATSTKESNLGSIVDMLLNSSMFVYFGTIIPWSSFKISFTDGSPVSIDPGRLIALLVLILLFRRIPFVLLLKPFIPAIRTWPEAWFAGHFGPMGVGALFLAIEARAQIETDTSEPEPFPPSGLPDRSNRAVLIIWPIICFIVLGSTMVHGLSTLAVSIGISLRRPTGERAPLLGAETEVIGGMQADSEDEE